MIRIVHFGSSKAPLIAEVVSSLGHINGIVDWQQATASDFLNIKGIILSGSPMMLTEISHEPFHEKYGFLKETKIPVLGICFGHQVLGILHGAEIFRGDHILRDEEIEVLQQDPLFADLGNKTIMAQSHTEGITLPAGFTHLASSATYQVQGIKHSSKKMYGVQFHPEVSGENGKVLLNNFCNLC